MPISVTRIEVPIDRLQEIWEICFFNVLENFFFEHRFAEGEDDNSQDDENSAKYDSGDTTSENIIIHNDM